MQTDRYEAGKQRFMEINPGGAQNLLNVLNEVSPDLARFVAEYAYGDIFGRNDLDFKHRELITIAVLATQGGCEPQLDLHINSALNVGLTVGEIVESILHCAPYIGFPKTINAMLVAKNIFEQRGLSVVAPNDGASTRSELASLRA